MKAKCEVVARMAGGGEEVRLYADGACVKTIHLKKGETGQYKEGEEYEVDASGVVSAVAPDPEITID